jgi:hypothetical protein
MCAEHGWDFDAVRLGPVDSGVGPGLDRSRGPER